MAGMFSDNELVTGKGRVHFGALENDLYDGRGREILGDPL